MSYIIMKGHNMSFEDILDSLFTYFNVSSISELANKLGVSQPAISKWKSRNSISAVKKKCRELGIYEEIFGDIQVNNLNSSSFNGNAAGVINGNQANTYNANSSNNDYCDDLTKELIKKLCILYKENQIELQTKLFELIANAGKPSQ